MDFETKKIYSGLLLKDKWHIDEIESELHLFEHVKSGAQLLYLRNTDDNKVFGITFRTPAADSCGTPHIMEHSVLCGSDKYPLKEPFVELLKSSMSTFLNAMTFPDKTVYPVASKNEADLHNLTDVYLDAVFNTSIKHNKNTFLQEGWHYHLENEDDPVTINGVVYNEMKGAYSSPNDILENCIMASLYPDTSYANDSGGNPDKIPELTYEKFLDLYNKYYHPSNSYIYLYGDMDPVSFFEHIDEYLSKYDRIEIDSLPELQRPFDSPAAVSSEYSVNANDNSEKNSYFAAGYRIGDASDSLLSYAFNVLGSILLDSDTSPLKKALLDAKIADEISTEYTTCLREPCFSVIAKNADDSKFQQFSDIIEKTLTELAENGIDQGLITSALNSYEFDLREADSGNYPKGLLFLFDILESWIYGLRPGIHLEYEKHLRFLRENETSSYYTDLIKKYLLDSSQRVLVKLSAKKGLAAEKNAQLEEKLAEYKKSLSEEQIKNLAETTNELIRRQAEADSEEARNTVPVLELSEIKKEIPKPDFEISEYKNSKMFSHCDMTRGIIYCDLYFPLNVSSAEEISYAELLTKMVGTYKTKNYSEAELDKQVGIYLGDIDAALPSYQNTADPDLFEAKFAFYVKALHSNTEKTAEITAEILKNTVIDDIDRVYQTVCEEISKFESKVLAAAHSLVSLRLSAALNPRGAFADAQNGFGYFHFLKKVKEEIEQGNCSILEVLSRLHDSIISNAPDSLLTADRAHMHKASETAKKILDALPNKKAQSSGFSPKPFGKIKEGIISASNVNYVGLGANFRRLGIEYTPVLLLAKKYLTSGFLWDSIRLIGGAYGSFMTADKTGSLHFISYRDPNLAATLEVYAAAADELKNSELSRTDLNKLIISTFSDIDAPKPVYSVGRVLLSDYYSGDSWENQMRDRGIILAAGAGDIAAAGSIIEETLKNASVCVVGDERSIESNASIFDTILSNAQDYK